MKSLPRPERSPSSQPWLIASFLYFICILYGSLLPFDFTFHPWDQAWQKFSAMPYLNLDARSRADWIANLLLYLPLGFVATGTAMRAGGSPIVRLTLLSLALAICLGTALGVEFAQVYFPPRTVSYNDLLAETLGTFAGMVIYLLSARKLVSLSSLVSRDKSIAILGAYSVGYLIFSLFPYDFLISRDEIAWKLSSPLAAFFLAGSGCTHTISCIAKLGAEALAVVPIGLLLSRHWPRAGTAFFLGALLGAAIEIAQLFLASGISQGASVLTRAIGLAIGCQIVPRLSSFPIESIRPALRWFTMFAVVPYLALLAALNGWATHNWLSLHDGLQRLGTLHFLPFYYHYYTTETVAVASLLTQVVMYAPIGLACWLWRPQKAARKAAFLAALIAMGIETGKLFVANKHPDPTDILIASVSAALAYALSAWWHGTKNLAASHKITKLEEEHTPMSNRLFALFIAACVVFVTWHYPLGAFWPAIFLTAYAAVLWRFPSAWVITVVALLPVMDLVPWTGWFFLDEFDLLLLVTLGVSLWHNRLAYPFKRLPAAAAVLLWLVTLSYLISLAAGLLPLQPITDLNAFSSYYGHYNALRVAKGFIWALLFLPVLIKHVQDGINLPQKFTYGMVLGLAALVLVVLWERYVFSGLFNFSNDYRITATFSTMHTGGGHVEGYLAVALPFVFIWVYQSKNLLIRTAGIILFALGVYSLLVTFSRGGYLALAIGGSILLLGIFFHARHGAKGRIGSAVFITLLLLIAASAISIPILKGTYIQSRFAQVGKDMNTRTNHWQDALRMIEPGWQASLFGMGLGRYPETYYWKNSEGVNPARYSYEADGDNVYLRLGSGNSLYVEQPVAVQPNHNYVLSMDLRSKYPNARITAPVCEKSLLYSFECEWKSFPLKVPGGLWAHYELHFNSKQIAKGSWLSRRPVKLSLFNSSNGTLIDVDNVALIDETGKNLVSNSDFSRVNENWFFSTDNHLPWHIKNLAVQVIFDQGWFGLVVFSLWIIYIYQALVKKMLQGNLFSTSLLAAISGFLAVGLFDSLFDAPRLTMLFFILLFLSIIQQSRARL